LEAVNYFEHWGLARTTRRVQTVDSWDTDSWFTLYTLVGLSRHADHHAYASRPFHQLRYFDESPKLPYGYFGSVVLALFAQNHLRKCLRAELERKRLGPFAAACRLGHAAAPGTLRRRRSIHRHCALGHGESAPRSGDVDFPARAR